MVLRSMPYGAAVRSTHVYGTKKRVVVPLAEEDILELQDFFLTNGIHDIVVDTVETGRKLMHTLLSSLNCYHSMAVLTLEPLAGKLPACDIYQELLQDNFFTDIHAIDRFFIEHFYFDFMWIERSEDLANAHWIPYFEQQLMEYKLEFHLPIVYIHYV